MHFSENEGIEGKKFVVTGGLGFVGSALCLELARRGADEVRSLDPRPSSPWSIELKKAGVQLIRGDVCEKKDVKKALSGANCVFHLASYGMSGKEMLQAGRVDQVNINGTCNILDACHEAGIKRLVYVSTYNVVFGGKEIVNGNESLPYFPLDEHVDPYGQSKSVAEQLVLKSNGRPSRNNSGVRLYTCAIRPAAIYGPGEERHLPRILSLAKMGLLSFNVGDSSIKTDWVYVDNLVLSLIMASMGLLDDIPGRKHPIAAGQAYFICDGAPVNTFDFIISPLLRKLDYDLPKITLDVKHALFMSRIIAFIYTLLYPWLNCRWLPGPLLLPAEVYKIGVTHYFSYLKAREELGYIPMVSPSDGLSKTISYWQERKRREIEGPTIFTTFLVLFGMFALFCAAFLPPLGPVKWVYNLSMFMFRSLWMTRLAFVAAVACHVGEGIYAWYLARRVDPQNALGWFWQTFALGFFSLRFLLKRAKSN